MNDEARSIFHVLEDSPIKSIEDIVGKTIAMNTLGAHLDYEAPFACVSSQDGRC